MTNEEAIKELNTERDAYQNFIEQGYSESEDIKRGLLALNLAIEALEKQTPQRVRSHAKVALGSDFGTCPRCEEEVVEDYAFCPTCGQALEWEG